MIQMSVNLRGPALDLRDGLGDRAGGQALCSKELRRHLREPARSNRSHARTRTHGPRPRPTPHPRRAAARRRRRYRHHLPPTRPRQHQHHRPLPRPPRTPGRHRSDARSSLDGGVAYAAFVLFRTLRRVDQASTPRVRMSDTMAAIRVPKRRRRGLRYAQRTPKSSDFFGWRAKSGLRTAKIIFAGSDAPKLWFDEAESIPWTVEAQGTSRYFGNGVAK